MKIICVDKSTPIGKCRLTIGKIYDAYIVYYDDKGFRCNYITNRYNYTIEDEGFETQYNGKRFITLEEYRNSIIDKILE